MHNFKGVAYLILFFLLLAANTSTAATITVTKADGCGAGTIIGAVILANSIPGHDTINFAPGIETITFPGCDGMAPPQFDISDFYYLWIAESVDIIAPIDVDPVTPGNQKLIIDGQGLWVDPGGQINTGVCPVPPSTNIIKPPGLLRVGSPNVDNSSISVTLKNLKVTRVMALARVNTGAGLSVIDSDLVKIADNYDCSEPLITLGENGKLIIDGAYIGQNQYLGGGRAWNFDSMLVDAFANSVTEIRDSVFELNTGNGAIVIGKAKLTIVNSLFDRSGGIMSLGGDVTLVNSAFHSSTEDPWEGIYANGGTVDISATTFSSDGWLSSTLSNIGTPPGIENASVLRFISTGSVNFDGVVIHTISTANQFMPMVYVDPAFQLTVSQSYSGDGSLAGSVSAPPLGINDAAPFVPTAITPLLGGPLVDQIDPTAKPLIDPLTGALITTDVYGNPRVIGALRDIGAVELFDAPVLTAAGADSLAILVWSIPDLGAGTAINEYVINYRETGSAPWLVWSRHDSMILEVVRNLTNGTTYDFRIAAETNLGQLPWSGVATATPAGPVHLAAATTSLSAATLHFGNIPVGNSSSKGLTISNSGNVDLKINLITPDNSVFTLFNDNCSHETVTPGSSCTLDVRFSPAAQGSVNGHILIPSNAASKLDKAGVSGIGDVASAFLSTAHLSFGDQIINTTSAPQTVTLTDNGGAPLSITSLASSSAEFVVSNDTCSGQTVNPGNQCTFDVHFTPTHVHGRSSSIAIISNAASSPDNVTVDGTGLESYNIRASTGTLQFGNQLIQTSSQPKQITLTNSGVSPLIFSGISIPSRFSVTADTCTGQTVTSGNSCAISVVFSPDQIGLISGNLQISSNHPDSPQSVFLGGTGVNNNATPVPVNSKVALFILCIGLMLFSLRFMKKV